MTQNFTTITVEFDNQICHIKLNRPEVRNAINDTMIRELSKAFEDIKTQTELRAVTLRGNGPMFCAGADLGWMKKSLTLSKEENKQDAQNLYDLFELIDRCDCPVIGAVHGYIPGGAVGLVSACDYVVADKSAKFSLSEVRLGIVPAIIGPFLLKKIGSSWCRALFLSSEPFAAEKALNMGLIHEVAESSDELEGAVDRLITSIQAASPNAIRAAKQFLHDLFQESRTNQAKLAVETLAEIRVSEDGQEGISAFLEKRRPRWKQS